MSNTLEIAFTHADKQGANKIHLLKMRVGALSGVVPEALEFAFDICTQGTIAQGAKLEIEYVKVSCYCRNCQLNFQPDDVIYECPHCHQISADIREGKELELASLEVAS